MQGPCRDHAGMPAAFQCHSSPQTNLSGTVLSRDCVCRYIGGWPSSKKWMPPGNPSVVDCTCELPRHHNNTYLCLPTWDTHGVCSSHVAGTCMALFTGQHTLCASCHAPKETCYTLLVLPDATTYRCCQLSTSTLSIRLATTASCLIGGSPCVPCSAFEPQCL